MFGSIRASAGEAVNHCGVRSWSTTITRMFGCADRTGARRAGGGEDPSVCSGTLVVGCWGGRRVRGGAVGVVAVGSATSLATAAIAAAAQQRPAGYHAPLQERAPVDPSLGHRPQRYVTAP